MTTGAIATLEKQDVAKDDFVTALEKVFETSFEIWIRQKCSAWTPESPSARGELSDTPGSSQLSVLLEKVHESGQPCTAESSHGQHWLALPLEGPHRPPSRCAVANFTIDSPQLLLRLAEAELRNQQQRTDLARMHEENGLFLKQVSDDFEEMTFLRSMAERLALGDCFHDVNELISYMMPLLGEAASVESLYYINQNSDGKSKINLQWFAEETHVAKLDHAQLDWIVKRFGQQASEQPVVKNHVPKSDLASELPGIREFILVAVATAMGPRGWLLAVNRYSPHVLADHSPLWDLSQNEFGTSEASLINTAATMLASHVHNVSLLVERESLLVSVVRTLVSAVESRDNYTCGHSERVALYGKRLALEVGYDQEACERLYLAGLLHDIGKIGISDAVLKKEGALTQEEFIEIQKHPDLGWAILRELKQMQHVLPGILHHHERVDGKGYPDQLKHNEIPQDGLLLAVVDAFDAMTSDRPYRQGMSIEKAVELFKQGAGSQWDATLVDAFLKILPDIVAIKENYHRPLPPARQPCKKRHGKVVADSRTANCPPICCMKG